jgi:uncharacterized protein (DUF1499 family)
MKTSVSVVAVLLLIGGFMFYKNNSLPQQLGVVNGQLAPVPSSPNGVSSQTQVITKQVAPLPFRGTLQDSKNKIIKSISSYPGTCIITQEDRYIHSVFTTPTMKFKDDVEFYFDESQQVIHFRSASRVGYSDMGMNRSRYQEIKNSYEKEE